MWKGDRRALSATTHMAMGVAFTCQENKSIDTLDSSNCLLWLPSQSFSQSHLNMGVLCVFGGGGVYIKIRILGKNIHPCFWFNNEGTSETKSRDGF